jgi:putative DNA methylase
MGRQIHREYPKEGLPPGAIYLSCGNSAKTDLPDRSVDLVVTDPPFFDNVHYSELADFFHVWQQEYFATRQQKTSTTRNEGEVQDTDAMTFSKKLSAVLTECHRVLRDNGRMVFSYHHSRDDGWSSIAMAVLEAGFSLVQAQPVKSEMSVAAPKSQAKEPIDLDVMMVCKKRQADSRSGASEHLAFSRARTLTRHRVERFNRTERRLSRNDVRVVLLSQFLVELCPARVAMEVNQSLNAYRDSVRIEVEAIWGAQQIFEQGVSEDSEAPTAPQLRLF